MCATAAMCSRIKSIRHSPASARAGEIAKVRDELQASHAATPTLGGLTSARAIFPAAHICPHLPPPPPPPPPTGEEKAGQCLSAFVLHIRLSALRRRASRPSSARTISLHSSSPAAPAHPRHAHSRRGRRTPRLPPTHSLHASHSQTMQTEGASPSPQWRS
jgi:hypothetical protein